MLVLAPAIGIPGEWMLQDTLKSAVVALCALGSAATLFWSLRHGSSTLQWHGLMWLPLALMAYALGSMLWSHTYLAAVEAVRWFVLALLLWLCMNAMSWKTLPTIAWAVHAGASLASVWAACQFWGGLDIFPQAFGIAPGSTFVNRNFFAEYAVSALPFSLGLLARLRNPRWAVAMALCVAFNTVALMMTGTRSALVALLLMLPMVVLLVLRFPDQFACMQWSRQRQWLVGTALVIGVLALGSIPSYAPLATPSGTATTALQRSFQRVGSVVTAREYTQGTFSTRVQMWRATGRMVQDNPWAGVGAGAWEVQIPRYQRPDTTLEMDYYPHNEALQLLSEYGLVGGVALAILLAYLLRAAGNTWRLVGEARQEVPVRAMALVSLVALLVVSCAGFPLHLAMTGALLAINLGLLAGSDLRLGKPAGFLAVNIPWHSAYARPAVLVSGACLLVGAFATLQAARVEYRLIHAIHISNGLTQGIPADPQARAARKSEMLDSIRQGIAINPHYRKITAELAEPLAAGGDWANVTWILESVVASRPHVTALWTSLAVGYARLGQHDKAWQALEQVRRLKPDAIATRTLEANLLASAGRTEEALAMLNRYLDGGAYDHDMVQTAYAIGYKTQHWSIAIRAQEMRIATWPQYAADGYFRLGMIYADPLVHEDGKAEAAFKAGWNQVPPEQRDNYRQQVPQPFRDRM